MLVVEAKKMKVFYSIFFLFQINRIKFSFIEKYWTNPQYLLIITKNDVVSKDGTAHLIISLMQKDIRKKRLKNKNNSSEEYIQFRLYQVLERLLIL